MEGKWLTVPVVNKGITTTSIKDIEIADLRMLRVISDKIRNYAIGKMYGYRLDGVCRILNEHNNKYLHDLNDKLQAEIIRVIGMPIKVINNFDVPHETDSKTRRIFVRLEKYGFNEGSYLIAKGTATYFKTEEAPISFRIYKQRLVEDISPDSIVQLIATETQPLEVIKRVATWD